jgi:hypothetical protein
MEKKELEGQWGMQSEVMSNNKDSLTSTAQSEVK